MDTFEFDPQAAATIPRRDFIKLGVGAGAMIALDPLGGSAQTGARQPPTADLQLADLDRFFATLAVERRPKS